MSSSNQSSDQNGFKKPATLGSKSRSFIPMTPRSLKKSNSDYRNDFARQVAEHSSSSSSRGHDGQPPQKKFKASAAPKGTKLASGYVDRAQERQRAHEDSDDNFGGGSGGRGTEDKQKRLEALEEMLKLQQIDRATFEKLREEIGIGGDISSTHLVKGLDFKLLERARRGEDLDRAPTPPEASAKEETAKAPEVEADVDDELEKALEKEIITANKPESQEANNDTSDQNSSAHAHAQEAPPLTRNEILRRIKQRHKAPNLTPNRETGLESSRFASEVTTTRPEPSEPRIDQSRFRKIPSAPKPNRHKFTETVNGRRREVLVITDKEGKTKRKTRWLDPDTEGKVGSNRSAVRDSGGKNQHAWGGDLPAEILAMQRAAAEEEEARRRREEEDERDEDIFGGVAEYDPLAGIDSDGDEEEEAEGKVSGTNRVSKDVREREEDNDDDGEIADMAHDNVVSISKPPKSSTSRPRNYFATTNTGPDEETASSDIKGPSHDPAILAALKRAAQIRHQEEAEDTAATVRAAEKSSNNAARPTQDQERSKALLAKLQSQSGYDDVDIDMGFDGNARYDDDDDENDGKQRLSQWKGVGEGSDEEGEHGGAWRGGSKRKRGGKKKKGDKNSYADVMSVIEGRRNK